MRWEFNTESHNYSRQKLEHLEKVHLADKNFLKLKTDL